MQQERKSRTVPPKFSFPLRDSMPHFVCALRQADEWKRAQAQRAYVTAKAESDINATYVKPPSARSLQIDELLRYLDDTANDINFMVQLPSIEKCLLRWWQLYIHVECIRVMEQDILRQVYYDLALVLVQAKTEMLHKNAVATIMRSSWTKWSNTDPPLTQPEFFRLLFLLGHLMTETNRLSDYVAFFQDTLGKIAHVYSCKAQRLEAHHQSVDLRRKASLAEIFAGKYSIRPATAEVATISSPIIVPTSSLQKPTRALSITLQRLSAEPSGSSAQTHDDDATRVVMEILERRLPRDSQHVEHDLLLNDRRFQEKWTLQPVDMHHATAQSIVRESCPDANRFCPPLSIRKLRCTPQSSTMLTQSKSVSALDKPATPTSVDCAEDMPGQREETELMAAFRASKKTQQQKQQQDHDASLRRSLSVVTLKDRMARQQHKHRAGDRQEDEAATIAVRRCKRDQIAFAIST